MSESGSRVLGFWADAFLDAVANRAMGPTIPSRTALGRQVECSLMKFSIRFQASSQASFHCSKLLSKKLCGAPT